MRERTLQCPFTVFPDASYVSGSVSSISEIPSGSDRCAGFSLSCNSVLDTQCIGVSPGCDLLSSPSIYILLFDDFGDDARANGAAALADSEA